MNDDTPIRRAFPEAATSDDLKRRVRTLAHQPKGPKTPMQVRILLGVTTAVLLGGFFFNANKSNRHRETAKDTQSSEFRVENHTSDPWGNKEWKGTEHNFRVRTFGPNSYDRTLTIYDICRNPKGDFLLLIGTKATPKDSATHGRKFWSITREVGTDEQNRPETPETREDNVELPFVDQWQRTLPSGVYRTALCLRASRGNVLMVTAVPEYKNNATLSPETARQIETLVPKEWATVGVDVAAATRLLER